MCGSSTEDVQGESRCYCVQSTKDFMSGMGLGMIADQLADLRLGELLDTPPPGLDEAVAIAKVCNLHSACLL
jgi:arsenite-transporting ATPase